MSELINLRDNRATIRWKLLTSASAFALSAVVSSMGLAEAEDTDRPVLWVELGGQFDFVNDTGEVWRPSNLPPPISHPVLDPLGQMARAGYDWDGKITLQPSASDWSFSASIQYGKARRGPKFNHDQTYKTHINHYSKYVPTTYAFADIHTTAETTHFIVDFQAGKDVGLGLFGHRGSSTLNFGIRVAQFQEKVDATMTAQVQVPQKYSQGMILDAYLHSQRSFTGIGPSVAWSGSVPLVGSLEDGLAFDWGANAAVLFGRQKAKVRTHTDQIGFDGESYRYSEFGRTIYYVVTSQRTHSTRTNIRNRGVIVPNLGGFAGISYRVGGRGKVSLGYRADFFFGAMDGGIDARRSEDIGFHGPFATVTLGLGG